MTPRSQKAREYRLIAAGSGGQGVLTIGKLIATAALREGNQVTYLPAYGSEVRGGTTSCHIVVSHERILSPAVEKPDSLILLNQASFERFSSLFREGVLLIVNTSLVKAAKYPDGATVIEVPATDRAVEMGSIQAANMLMLGAFTAASGLCRTETMRQAVQEALRTPRKEVIELNLRAFDEGAKSAS
jgi:2-oxoglutarate ferredoxin oxidoreductase subunit gamma